MDRLIYTAMTGASAAQNRQALLSNNLANVSTNAFRAEMYTYRAVPLRGDGATTRVFALEASAGHRNAPGPGIRTGREMDIMPKENNWFAVQAPDGTEAYTRTGSLTVSSDGTLQTSTGHALLSDSGTTIVVPREAKVSLGADGTVNIVGRDGRSTIQVSRMKIATPTADDPLKRGDDGLFRPASGRILPNDDEARILTGALEGSNVNAVETMVGMIQTARQFEHQMKLMQNAESNDRAAGQLLNLQG